MPPSNGVWDTHVHVLDPSRFRYSSQRTYTPPAALPRDLFAASEATNFLLVQATVEDGPRGLLHQLSTLQRSDPTGKLRAALLVDFNNLHSETAALAAGVDELHTAGVRCLRLHGQFQASSEQLLEAITTIVTGTIGEIARQHQWCLSIRLPLDTWAAVKPVLQTHGSSLRIIAEHCGGVTYPLSNDEAAAFEAFLGMLRERLTYVKLGAFHRRVKAGHNVAELLPSIHAIPRAGPHHLLWGSDWPHVNFEAKGDIEAPCLEVNDAAELDILRRSMSEICFHDMLRVTPATLFD